MDLGLAGRGFLVLGAGRGLGRAIADVLVDEGAHVVAGSRSGTAHPPATGLVVDVAAPDLADLRAAVAGLDSLDGLVLNSGGPPPGTALELGEEAWLAAFRLLVTGPLALLRELLPVMARPASVLWITSSSVRQPIAGLDASNLLRPGIAALVTSLAQELGPDVRVNSLAPGRFDTDRVRELDAARAGARGVDAAQIRAEALSGIPLGRYGDPPELGRVGAFLLSPAASYVTGAAVQVDGGVVTAVP